MKKAKQWIALAMCSVLFLTFSLSMAEEPEGWICPNCGHVVPYSEMFCPNHVPGSQPAASWPELTLPNETVKLRSLGDSERRHQAYYGPAKTYPDAGAYKPAKATKVIALFSDGEYVLVDMNYQTAGRCCLYFRYSAVEGSHAEAMPDKTYPAKTKTMLIPMLGPGTEYLPLVQTTPSKYENWSFADLAGKFGGSLEIYEALKPQKNKVYLEPETEVSVFFETNGWAFAEFQCAIGLVRAWLPADSLI